jgi:hypothetical protein
MDSTEAEQAVRLLLDEGVSQREITRRLTVSKGFVWRVRRGIVPHAPSESASPSRRIVLLDPSDAERLTVRVDALEKSLAEVGAQLGTLISPTRTNRTETNERLRRLRKPP